MHFDTTGGKATKGKQSEKGKFLRRRCPVNQAETGLDVYFIDRTPLRFMIARSSTRRIRQFSCPECEWKANSGAPGCQCVKMKSDDLNANGCQAFLNFHHVQGVKTIHLR